MYYGVVDSRKLENLTKTVNYLLIRGCSLVGGLSIDGWDNGTHFYQAMMVQEESYYDVDNLTVVK